MTTVTDIPTDFLVMQDAVRLHATHQQTGGAFFVMEVTVAPGGGPPPIHSHAPHELFHTLEGELTYFRDDGGAEPTAITGGPGTTAFIPGGVPHTYRNFSDAPGRYLAVLSGASMQDFLVAAGVPADAPPRTPEEVIAISAGYGVEWTDLVPGPPRT